MLLNQPERFHRRRWGGEVYVSTAGDPDDMQAADAVPSTRAVYPYPYRESDEKSSSC